MSFQRFGNGPQTIQKPEYVLKRANDLINTAMGSGEREKRMALDQIHAHISIKRGKNNSVWNKTYEVLMKRHLELCVDLKDHRTAKDGLHQYRNLSQAMDPASLEVVALHVMELAEAKATAARAKADKVALAAAAKISDLEQEESPESIMLSSMTEEGARHRTDREVVVPWLKFLWETYRSILELLYKNSKLERVYHKTCEKAFVFCRDYQRTMEFKRLCGMLREHLQNLQKSPAASLAGRPPRVAWEWTSEAMELHLQTRFAQLEVATQLELWNEGFKTVEEIYTVIEIGRRQPRPRIMATYYEKLMRIFWVSDNYLFHAYCSYRFYCLTCDSRSVSPEEKSVLASTVLLAALCIPAVHDGGVNTEMLAAKSLDEEDVSFEKNQKMAKLLDFTANPTRQSLLKDVVDKGLLEFVIPSIKDLYNLMESKFHPLTLASSVVSAVNAIKVHTQLNIYAIPLQRVAVLRVLLQLGHVFSTVKIDFLKNLLSPLEDVSYLQVERIMVDGIARKQLQLKIDHGTGCLNFATSSAIKDSNVTVDTQARTLAFNLTKVNQTLREGVMAESMLSQEAQQRREFLAKVASSIASEHAALAERKKLIEFRKENLERMQQDRLEIEKNEAIKLAAFLKKQEEDRVLEEARMRTLEDRRKNKERLEIIRVQKNLNSLGITKTEVELTALAAGARDMLLLEAKSGAQKEKDDEAKRITDQAKRLDYITRALRIEGGIKMASIYEKTCAADMAKFVEQRQAQIEDLKNKHAADLATKARLSKMQKYRASFESRALQDQEKAYNIRTIALRETAVKEMRHKLVARARRFYNEAMEEERAAAEEAEFAAIEHAELRERERIEEEAQLIRAKNAERKLAEEERLARLLAQNAREQTPTGQSSQAASVRTFGEKKDSGGFVARDSGDSASAPKSFGFGAQRTADAPSDRRSGGDRESEGPSRADGAGSWAKARMESSTAPAAHTWKPSGGASFGGTGGGGSTWPKAGNAAPSYGAGSGGEVKSEKPRGLDAAFGGRFSGNAVPSNGAGSGGEVKSEKPRGLDAAFGGRSSGGARPPTFGERRKEGSASTSDADSGNWRKK